jgi:hypothetical protein
MTAADTLAEVSDLLELLHRRLGDFQLIVGLISGLVHILLKKIRDGPNVIAVVIHPAVGELAIPSSTTALLIPGC